MLCVCVCVCVCVVGGGGGAGGWNHCTLPVHLVQSFQRAAYFLILHIGRTRDNLLLEDSDSIFYCMHFRILTKWIIARLPQRAENSAEAQTARSRAKLTDAGSPAVPSLTVPSCRGRSRLHMKIMDI